MSYKNTNLCSGFAICEVFNKYFATVYKIDNERLTFPSESIFPVICLTDFFISLWENLNEYNKCKSGTNSVDGISPNIIILVLQFCLYDIFELFNCIVSDKHFQNIWKLTHTNPLHKKIFRPNFENYRPTSIFPALALIFERVSNNKIKGFNQIKLCKNQHGFRKDHSTVTKLILYCDVVNKKLEQAELPLTLFLDFAKAFDSISHNNILYKLAKIRFDQ